MPKPKELHHFFTKVVGVSHQNDDGTQRQALIARCRLFEKLVLDHDENNPHDPNAVRVCRAGGEQLGFLRSELAEEVVRLAGRSYLWAAFICGLTGGTADAPSRGVNVLLVRAAPGVSAAEAQAYCDKLMAEELSDRVDDFAGMTSAKPKARGCGTGILLLGVVILVCLFGVAAW